MIGETNLPRIGINKQQVFKAAKEIAATGKTPTAEKVRNLLTTGSITTVQKYLRLWKKKCFIQANSYLTNEVIKISPLQEESAHDELLEKNRDLEQALNKQITQNEHYVQELINAEKANIVLKEEINQLQGSNQELHLRLTKAEATNHALEDVTQKIQKELNINTDETIQTMQQTIDELRDELKFINKTSLIALRETSTKGHEAVMQEKVISINLQAKIDSLTKELLESKKQLELVNIKAQVHTQSLQRQIDQQQKILKNYLNSAQLQELAQGIEVNYTLEVGCGK